MKSKTFRGNVLVVDDEGDIRSVFRTVLEDDGFVAHTAGSIDELKIMLEQRTYDAILLDVYLGDDFGLDIVPYIAKRSPRTKVIMMSARGTVELAVDAMERGASSFISKTKNVIEVVSALRDRLALRLEYQVVNEHDLGIVGESAVITAVKDKIRQVRDVQSNVLIVGESGTGKELVARAIHNTSNRGKNPFVAINCGAIPGNLLESELFGHKKGAFTDAKTDRRGVFEICDKGTLLLDEIGEMPPDLQVKLLRVLQEREITPLGGGRSVKIDTRIVAATNKNPLQMAQTGKFREDLYYRLSVITIELPPLRQRRTDIPALVEYFLAKINNQFDKHVAPPSAELLRQLLSHDWPGNIRELQNAVERGVVLSHDGQLHAEHMFQSLSGDTTDKNKGSISIGNDIFGQSLTDAKREFEREYLSQLLQVTHGNVAEIARISNRYRADIYRLLTKHGLEWDEYKTVPCADFYP